MTSEFTIAVHALVFLHHNGGLCSSEGLAENICTNPARIRKIMAKLKKAGIVDTKEGIEGGYHYVDNPQELSLYKVAKALDFDFVSCGWKSGNEEKRCVICSGMRTVMDELYEELNKACYEKLKNVTVCDFDRYLFKGQMFKDDNIDFDKIDE